MPGARKTAKGATTRRAAVDAHERPVRRVQREDDRRDGCQHAAQAERQAHAAECTASGRSSAASSPPSATDIWRMPIAKPRRSGGKPWKTETVAPTATSGARDAAREQRHAEPERIGQQRADDEQERRTPSRRRAGACAAPSGRRSRPAAISANALPSAVALTSAPSLAALRP